MAKRLVEHSAEIDVGRLARAGAFNGPPMEFPFLGLETRRYVAVYRPMNAPPDRPPQRIAISWTRCRFGGSRPWFHCSACGCRAAKLYRAGWLYLCRRCCDLAYQSQRLSRKGRLYLKAVRTRRLMGDEGRPAVDPLPARLPGKHRKTHSRRCAELGGIEQQLGGRTKPYKLITRQERRD